MKKLYLLIMLLLFPILSLNAVSSDDVDYDVEGIYINGSVELGGAVRIKEIIKLDGTFNGYIRDLTYKNDKLKAFTGIKDNFYGSDIYNGSGIQIYKVGVLDIDGDFKYENFTDEYINENLKVYEKESNSTYEVSEIKNGKSIKMYNETKRGTSYFYVEYAVLDVSVLHNDCAEVYYSLIGDEFADNIGEVKAVIYIPYPDEDNLRIWAHGPLNGESYIIDGGYGAILKIEDLSAYTPVDLRMIYPKEQFMISFNENKKSNMDAKDLILEVETERANKANEERKTSRIITYVIFGVDGIYLLSLIFAIIYVYRKYDKEYISTFKNKYNREFIEDYDVEVIDYLMRRTIGSDAFSASILNLIYKKKIKAEKIDGKKEDYKFTLIDRKSISKEEEEIVKLLFDEIGSKDEVKMSEIKKASKKDYNSNKVYETFVSWKESVKNKALSENFYESNIKVKVLFGLYSLAGVLLSFISFNIGLQILPLITAIFSIVFLVYILVFSKRSQKGNEHYIKWKAFKRFLEDFGRFEEKELPEIVLWERYLVYATVLGVADKVSKEMKTKFDQMNINDNTYNNTLFNYYMFTNMSRDINSGITSAVQNSISIASAAQSSDSSGSGFGGGFSSGGGFGGGGGGGRGF